MLNDFKDNEFLEFFKDKVLIFSFGGLLSFGVVVDLGYYVCECVKLGFKVIILDFLCVLFMDVFVVMVVDIVILDVLVVGC